MYLSMCARREKISVSGYQNQNRLDFKYTVFRQVSVWSFLHLPWLRASKVSERQVFTGSELLIAELPCPLQLPWMPNCYGMRESWKEGSSAGGVFVTVLQILV